MPTDDQSLTPVADGVWLANEPVSIVGMSLTATMTVLALDDANALVYSPIALSPKLRSAVESVGRVAHLYAPNTFHHLHIAEWAAIYPEARVHAPAGLGRKRADLEIDRSHGDPADPAFAATIDEVEIRGFRLEESVVLHRPSRTLVVADLVHNVGRPDGIWPALYTRAMGFHDRVALSRMIRWTGFSDRAASRASIDRVLALPFDRIVVGHGAPIERGAKQALAEAFEWLSASK